MKIPKLGDLTDLNKLKKMGSSLAESAKVGEMMGKVKQAVGDSGKLIDKAKSTVGLGGASHKETDSDGHATPIAQIQQSLADIFTAQKAQLAAMNQLKQAVSALLKQNATASSDDDETDDSSDTGSEAQDDDMQDDDEQHRN